MKRMLLAALAAALMLSACTSVPGDAAAVVGDSTISAAELDEQTQAHVGMLEEQGEEITLPIRHRMQGRVLFELIDQEMTRQQLEAMGLSLDEDRVAELLAENEGQFGSPEEFARWRVQNGFPTMENWERRVLHILREELIAGDPAAASRACAAIELEIPSRFGTWEDLLALVAPQDLVGRSAAACPNIASS